MKKRMLRSMLLTCMLVIMLMPTVALAEGGHSHTDHCTCGGSITAGGHTHDATAPAWTPWNGTDTIEYDADSNTAYVYLSANATPGSSLEIPSGKTLYLCLNGHSITINGKITVASGGSLTITDCSTDVRHGYIGADYLWKADPGATECNLTGGIINGNKSGISWGDCVVSIEGGAFTLYGGNLSGSKCEPVLVTSGTFTMYGGNITGNGAQGVNNSGTFIMHGGTISYNGARGVSVGGGGSRFTMYNGTITNNKASRGGGVNVSGGTFIMKDGTISGNKATDEGGGVYVSGNGTFTMENGDISNNQADEGGGVYVYNGTFTMNGDISNNQADKGGGVYFSGDGSATSCTFTMKDGTISKNKVDGPGGGVYVSQKTFIMEKGDISNNEATNSGGGVYVSNGTFTMEKGDITKNSVSGSDKSGGGVYVTGGEFNMKAGNITYNTAPNGSAVLTTFTSTFNMSGGSITNNTVTGNSADYCAVCAYGTIELSGNCTIFDNKTETESAVEKNLFVPADKTITIADELGNNAKIGVTTGNNPTSDRSVTIIGSCSADYSKHFFSDDAAQYHIEKGASNTVVLATGATTYTVTWDVDGVKTTKEFAYGATPSFEGSTDKAEDAQYTYTFHGWDSEIVPVDGDKTYTATYTSIPKQYAVSVNASEGGTVSGGGNYDYNASVTITATPANGYELNTIKVYKTGDENATITVTGNQFTMPAYDVTVSVTFKEISSSSSSGRPSGRPSSSSSGITSKTEKNEDGSSTTTTTNRITGTVAETTKNTDGTTGTTVTDKNGNITKVSAKVPAAAATTAEKAGKPVTVPVEVPAAKSSEEALSVKVDVPSGGAAVEIPVENVTPGTVVVIVAKDGTEQVVRTSSVSENGVVVKLEKDATVKVVDMSRDFKDVHPVNHWATDAIDFVAARGIFNGTSPDTFNPNGSMTRQAMWMTLARMSGEEPADMAAAREWAVENAVSDGSNPLGTVTRQQYVTMLWRWAAAEGMDVSGDEETNILSYTDANKISDYAVEAFQWACSKGIVGGYDDGSLRALTNASRAHAAAMMMRFCASAMK